MDTSNSTFEPTECPVGINNTKDIEHLGDRLDMAIERLTEKVGELKEEITTLSSSMDKKFESMDDKFDEKFNSMDNKIDKVDKKIDAMEDKFYERISDLKKKIPSTVEAEIDKKKASAASAAVKWILCGVVGTIVVSIATAWAKAKLGI